MLSAERTSTQPFLPSGSPIGITTDNSFNMESIPAPSRAASAKVEHIFIITGPAGCGKTSVARYLAANLQLPYVEGDDFHSQANKDKMANSIALTDADRWDWLITVREEALRQLQTSNAVVVTCSALKRKYRDVIRIANYEHSSVQIHFVFLSLDEETLTVRVGAREGHYMGPEMVHSQMQALEAPEDESDAMCIDANQSLPAVCLVSLEAVKAKLAVDQARV